MNLEIKKVCYMSETKYMFNKNKNKIETAECNLKFKFDNWTIETNKMWK